MSADRQGKGGALVMLDARDLSLVRSIAMPGSVLGMHWDAALNQIFVAAGVACALARHLGTRRDVLIKLLVGPV